MFFCHAVWIFKRRHPANFLKASTIDPSNLMSDPIVYWNHHLFDLLFIATGICLPTLTGYWLTEHSLFHCFIVCYGLKHVVVTQMASLLNSAAHMFGDKPYNGKIMATDDSLLAKFSLGEGYHKWVNSHSITMHYYYYYAGTEVVATPKGTTKWHCYAFPLLFSVHFLSLVNKSSCNNNILTTMQTTIYSVDSPLCWLSNRAVIAITQQWNFILDVCSAGRLSSDVNFFAVWFLLKVAMLAFDSRQELQKLTLSFVFIFAFCCWETTQLPSCVSARLLDGRIWSCGSWLDFLHWLHGMDGSSIQSQDDESLCDSKHYEYKRH